ncbi:sulfotransferase 1C2-like [Centruroides vittatus]|uniref:sulfotransferase 1C2-like n=1 Tax=Centruroides vittatus TaxID=120091 RepID=UPI00350F8D8A
MPVKPTYLDCDGFLIAAGFSKDAYRSVVEYKPKPDDIFIATYPKCGTTWMQYIVTLILRKGEPFADGLDFFTNSPFLEMTGADAIETMRKPGVLKTHLPIHLVPFSPEAKYIYVARNPKDCCVSFYYHTKLFSPYNFENGTFEDYFEVFIRGEVDWGDYFDHLLGWYAHRNDPNVYFTTYENMKKDIQSEIFKVAAFLGDEYLHILQEDKTVLNNVLRYSSLDYMRVNMNALMKEFYEKLIEGSFDENILPSGLKALQKNIRASIEAKQDDVLKTESKEGDKEIAFVRKGVVGDWKNHFTPEQEKILEEKIREKTKNSDVMNLWKDI